MDDIQLSTYGRASSEPSPVNRMMAAFAADFRDGIDINLGVGYVNENTIPREHIREGMGAVLDAPEKYRLALNYGGPKGSPNLEAAVRQYLIQNRMGGLTKDALDRTSIVVGPNGASSLLEGLAYLVEPGIVITADPMYYIYCNFLERRGFEVLAVPEDDDGIRVDALETCVRELGDAVGDVRYFYIVTVGNPTCTILSNERRRGVVNIASDLSEQLGRKVPVFFDKAYEGLVHDPDVPPLESGLLHDKLGIVYEIETLSKILAPALRIGYMLGPDGPLLRAMVQRTSDAGFSAPLITQEIASHLLEHHVAEQVAGVNAGYRDKARRVRAAIEHHLGDVLESCTGGRAGFYFYLTFKDIETNESSDFFRFLARSTGDAAQDGPAGARFPRVAYVPGEFCVHPQGRLVEQGKRQLRLSYGYEETSGIEDAVGHMAEAAAYARRAG